MRLIDANKIKIKPEYMYDICGSVMIRVEDVARIINDMPTIEPQKWIPCSERMPEDYTRVLTTNSKIGAWEVDINSRNVAGWIYSSDPVAWMPLPEPYKAESEEA